MLLVISKQWKNNGKNNGFRNQTEWSFDWLKGRWDAITRNSDLKQIDEKLPAVIYAFFVWHNLCKKVKLHIDEQLYTDSKKTILVFSFDCNVDIIARKIAAKYFNEFLTDVTYKKQWMNMNKHNIATQKLTLFPYWNKQGTWIDTAAIWRLNAWWLRQDQVYYLLLLLHPLLLLRFA